MIEKPNISGCNLSRDMSENRDGKRYVAFEASDENIDNMISVESMEYGETMDNIKTANCSLFSSIPLHKFEVIGILLPLGLICLVVTCGNILVISAVKISPKLDGPTHQLIMSLAVADLLLGTLVLPLSAVYEVLDTWVFGQHLCFIWLTV